MKHLLFVLALVLPASAQNQPPPQVPQPEKAAAATPERRSINGFGAHLLITPDADWKAKWDTPAATTPRFTTTSRIRRGERVTVLFLFTNPLPDPQGAVDVTLDLRMVRPDGKVTEHKNVKAMKGPLRSPASNTYRAEPVIEFLAAPEDPLGEYVYEVTLNDLVRKVSVPVNAKLTVLEK